MENKYYTPEIEEFHQGFEYERWINSAYTHEKYIKETFEFIDNDYTWNDDITNMLACSYSGGDSIRVKHLDKEDIESLGFDNIDVRYFKLITPDKLRSIERTEIWISKLGDLHYKIIRFDHYKNSGSERVLFSGIIKNKSELKVLLKQLGIK